MRRREFITLLGGAATLPMGGPQAAHAQQLAMPVIGILDTGDEADPERQRRSEAFRRGLQELGWSEDRNVKIHHGWGGAQTTARELVALRPDVLFAEGSPSVVALLRETRTIPIVFANVSDPVGASFVASLARPGGNVTGFTNFEYVTAGKWLELLKEVAPQVARVAVLVDPDNPQSPGRQRVINDAAPALGVQIVTLLVRNGADIENTLAEFAREPGGGLLVPPGTLPITHRDLIIALSARYRLPAVHSNFVFAKSGGLLSYGIDANDECRRAASYVDRILKGEKPADLPVQAPTKFELVINLETAKALGLVMPATLLARADEVIE